MCLSLYLIVRELGVRFSGLCRLPRVRRSKTAFPYRPERQLCWLAPMAEGKFTCRLRCVQPWVAPWLLAWPPCPAPGLSGGGERTRTVGLLRARQALSHLGYTPDQAFSVVGLVRVELTTSRLSGVRSNRN